MAGFFDGEGCVNIGARGKCGNPFLRVQIVNTDYELLQLIQSQYGGHLRRRDQKGHKDWKPFCYVIFTGQGAIEFLDRIRPYALLKHPQISLAFGDCLPAATDSRAVL